MSDMETTVEPAPPAPPAPPDLLVSIHGITRVFDTLRAVDQLSFGVPRGKVTGFIGANGAGKTTTMRILAGLDYPDLGSVYFDGMDLEEGLREIRKSIGWMPDTYGVWNDMSIWEYLDFFGRAYGYKGEERAQRIAEVMEFTDLAGIADRQANKLSKGMSQRLCLGRALINDPSFLILDEPAAGLDPKARMEFKRLVRLLVEEGKTILISSHILSELSEMCDHMVFIDKGKLIFEGDADQLEKSGQTGGPRYRLRLSGDWQRMSDWVVQHPAVELGEVNEPFVSITFHQDAPEEIQAFLRGLVVENFPLLEFRRDERRLEDAFIEMVQGLDRKEGTWS